MAAEALERASDDQEEFEKARFDYCWLVYESELKRQQQIESKIQFYLSFITLFLGVIFFNLNSISSISELIIDIGTPHVSKLLITGGMVVLAIFLVSALIIIIHANRFLEKRTFYPKDFSYHLFSKKSGYILKEDAKSLYYKNSRILAAVIPIEHKNNNERTKFLPIVPWLIFVSVLALIVIMVVFIYHSIL